MYQNGVRHISAIVSAVSPIGIKKCNLDVLELSVSMAGDGEVKRSLSLVCADSSDVDWYRDWIQVEMADGGEKKSLGIFAVGHVEKNSEGPSSSLKIEGYDGAILAQEDCLTERLCIQQGAKYLDTIQFLLLSCGLTRVISDESDAVFATDRDDWDIGTSKLKIINQLLGEISFRELEIDERGFAKLRRYIAPSISQIDHTYQAGKASILHLQSTISSDSHEIPNIFVAVVSNPDLERPLIAKYINDNPLSKTSTVYTGRNKVKALSVNNIATQEDLQQYVSKAAFEAIQVQEEVTFSTALEWGHGINDIVALNIPQFQGVGVETQWSMDFNKCEMSHTVKRVVFL